MLLIFLINVAINIKSFVFLQENMKETFVLDWGQVGYADSATCF